MKQDGISLAAARRFADEHNGGKISPEDLARLFSDLFGEGDGPTAPPAAPANNKCKTLHWDTVSENHLVRYHCDCSSLAPHFQPSRSKVRC